MIVDRRKYIDQLRHSKGNGLIKIVTGLRRSGKSFLFLFATKEVNVYTFSLRSVCRMQKKWNRKNVLYG